MSENEKKLNDLASKAMTCTVFAVLFFGAGIGVHNESVKYGLTAALCAGAVALTLSGALFLIGHIENN